jgi:hypothetical protein
MKQLNNISVHKMIIMRKICFCLFVLSLLYPISGCNKIADVAPDPTMYDLSFNIQAGKAPGSLKDAANCINENKTASYVEVTLMKEGDVTSSTIAIDVFYISGQPYSNSIKLSPGTYSIKEFVMKNDNKTPDNLIDDPIIAAAVHEGAPFANLVTSWLAKEFTISPFKKNMLEVELVCYNEADFESFGFEYFRLDQTVVREQNFFGDLCIRNMGDYYNSPYSEMLGGNANLLLDLPALYQIEVLRNDTSMGIFDNYSVTEISQPLKVQYADRLGKTDNFKFELSVLVKSDAGFQYELFHTWSFKDGEKISSGTDGVVDFVLGNCVPDADLIIPYAGSGNEAPVANNVQQSGNTQSGQILTGSYVFYDAEGDMQGTSVIKWYRADDASGNHDTEIANATGLTYTLQAADLNKYIRFAVIPVALTGSLQGTEVKAEAYSGPVTPASFTCGSSITVSHTAGNVSPVSKNVTYGTVTNIPGEPSKCWITSNLGSDHQANAKNDNSEGSAGWYWQFNRKQGYKHNGTTRTPNAVWIDAISENIDWQAGNDPCALLLGGGWRIPTKTEWQHVEESGNWSNCNDAFDSGLKLHAAGSLHNYYGSLQNRGSEGSYWSSTKKNATNGKFLFFNSSSSWVDDDGVRSNGFTLRCVLD